MSLSCHRSSRALALVLALSTLTAAAWARAGDAADATRSPAVLSIGNVPLGAPLPAGFIGLSLEYDALPAYAGTDPAAVDPVFEQLIRDPRAVEPGISLVTVHRYPLQRCFVAPGSPQYPTIAHLLSAYAGGGLAQSTVPLLAVARPPRLALRLDELNSVTCGGTVGVSDSYASAPRALQTMFALDLAGPLTGSSRDPGGAAWATIAPDNTIRAVLISDARAPQTVLLQAPAGATGPATAEQLQAPSLTATSAITLAGQSFAPGTTTGSLAGTRQTRRCSAGDRPQPPARRGSAARITGTVQRAGRCEYPGELYGSQRVDAGRGK